MNNSKVWQPSDIHGVPQEPEGESPRRRGRIPQTAWPRILDMHKNGSTLTAIAKEFDCTPSAISYIIKKAEASGTEITDVQDEPTDAPVAPTASAPAPAERPTAPRAASTGQLSLSTSPRAASPEPRAPEPRPTEPRPTEPRAAEPRPTEPRPAGSRIAGQIGLKDMTPSMPVPPTPPPPPPAPVAAPAQAATPTPGGRTEPAPVDATEGRLRETARASLVAYRNWRQTPGEKSIQTLGDAVHELRRVLARIEIDMAASRRDEQAARPIPIPWHRSARRVTPQGGNET
jgi:transposase-like protein